MRATPPSAHERRDPLALSAMRRLTSHPVVQIACAAAFTTATLAAALWCTEGHDPGFWIAPGLSTLVVSFAGLVLCVGLWITAVALRWIGPPRIRLLLRGLRPLLQREGGRGRVSIFPPVGYGSAAIVRPSPRPSANGTFLFWIHRNGGLFVLGFGVGLVLFESLRWRARRRHGPEWIPLGA